MGSKCRLPPRQRRQSQVHQRDGESKMAPVSERFPRGHRRLDGQPEHAQRTNFKCGRRLHAKRDAPRQHERVERLLGPLRRDRGMGKDQDQTRPGSSHTVAHGRSSPASPARPRGRGSPTLPDLLLRVQKRDVGILARPDHNGSRAAAHEISDDDDRTARTI